VHANVSLLKWLFGVNGQKNGIDFPHFFAWRDGVTRARALLTLPSLHSCACRASAFSPDAAEACLPSLCFGFFGREARVRGV
jgi:hypothetical protein